MKKLNKTLTRALVILLSLVLLTSSVVSTTLAKYTVTKDAKTSVGLQKFGLVVTLEPIAKLGAAATTTKTGNSISLTYNKVTLTPGDVTTYKDAIVASIKGTATVDANVIISIDIDCGDEKFKLTSADFTNKYTTPMVYNPIEFFVAGTDCGATGELDVDTNDKALEKNAESMIAAQIKAKMGASSTKITVPSSGHTNIVDNHTEVNGTIAKNATVALNNINFGFGWETDTTITNANEIETFISDKEPVVTITYKITVEQKS